MATDNGEVFAGLRHGSAVFQVNELLHYMVAGGDEARLASHVVQRYGTARTV